MEVNHQHAHEPHVHHPGCGHQHVCWGAGQEHTHHHRLRVSDISVNYHEVVALEDIHFDTECGRSIALIGPNGAGKSTLLKTLAHLIVPDHGQILWKGQRMQSSSNEIAYLPQRGDVDWNFPITVRGLVEMGRYPNLGWWRPYSRHDGEIVERALAAMELLDLQKRQISALSGGQQQRTFIARALAQEAHVLLLDEPFTGLDKPSQETLHRLFRDLTKEGRLLIASHHDLATVPAIFDDVLLLKRKQLAFGPVSDVLTKERIGNAYAV
ncbi:MAG: ATP-binding cassette domain-containing protein [Verrucomicrobiaceae bacterium]|nr:ATP-binding cassette domain-containing protein [Verrucomicrobiaceae bacterium]